MNVEGKESGRRETLKRAGKRRTASLIVCCQDAHAQILPNQTAANTSASPPRVPVLASHAE